MTYEEFQKIAEIIKEASKFMDVEEVVFYKAYDCVEVSGNGISIEYDLCNDTVDVNAGDCAGGPHIEIRDLKLTEAGFAKDIRLFVKTAFLDRIRA